MPYVTISRPDVACRNFTNSKQHNVFAAEGNASALVVADTLRMAIPIIMGDSSGSSKKGEIQGLLTTPLNPPVAGGGGGGGLWKHLHVMC